MASTLPDLPIWDLLELVHDPLFVLDAGGVVRWANPALAEAMGQPLTAILHHGLGRSSDEQRMHFSEPVQQCLRSRRPMEFDVHLPNTGSRWVELWPLAGGRGEVTAIFGVVRDVRRQDPVARALSAARHELHALYDDAPCGYLNLDLKGGITRANRLAVLWLGLSATKTRPKGHLSGLLDDASRAALQALWPSLLVDSAQRQLEVGVPQPDGPARCLLLTLQAIRETAGGVSGVRVSVVDLTERRQAETRLRQMALTDELTGLCNLRGFRILADQELKAGRRGQTQMLVLYADVDGLKLVNDTYGHDAGNALIQQAARFLRQTLRERDILARLGGDEFAALLPGTHDEAGVHTRMKEALAQWSLGTARAPLEISWGVAPLPSVDEAGLEAALDQADRRMYEHKVARKKQR